MQALESDVMYLKTEVKEMKQHRQSCETCIELERELEATEHMATETLSPYFVCSLVHNPKQQQHLFLAL